MCYVLLNLSFFVLLYVVRQVIFSSLYCDIKEIHFIILFLFHGKL
jgi:hypothetical protein